MKLIIQIPCLNEAETLRLVVSELPVSLPGVDCIETLVIDDGSVDGTAEVARAIGVHHILRLSGNRGLARAFAAGLRYGLHQHADIIVNTDGDGQYLGDAIQQLIQPILEGRADLVIGNRNPWKDNRIHASKRLLYAIGSLVVSGLAGQSLPDPVSGFRAFHRCAAARMHILSRYSYTLETVLQASWKRVRIEHVSIATRAATRPSRLMRNTWQFLFKSGIALVKTTIQYHASAILSWLSLLIAAMGILAWIFVPSDQSSSQSSAIDPKSNAIAIEASVILLSISILTAIAAVLAELSIANRMILELQLEPADCERTLTGSVAKPASGLSNDPQANMP